MNSCLNCVYEYRCDWAKAGENMICDDWKGDAVKEEENKDVVS